MEQLWLLLLLLLLLIYFYCCCLDNEPYTNRQRRLSAYYGILLLDIFICMYFFSLYIGFLHFRGYVFFSKLSIFNKILAQNITCFWYHYDVIIRCAHCGWHTCKYTVSCLHDGIVTFNSNT